VRDPFRVQAHLTKQERGLIRIATLSALYLGSVILMATAYTFIPG